MDAINFINYLRNPRYLHQVTFQEINNLIEQYPYCQNLHYLALRKAQYENHKDFEKKLEIAATYSPDRRWLYKQLQDTKEPEAISDIARKLEALVREDAPQEALPIADETAKDTPTLADQPETPSPITFDDEHTEALVDSENKDKINEDMKLPNDKKKKVIYMEDLIEEIQNEEKESPSPALPDPEVNDASASDLTPPNADEESNVAPVPPVETEVPKSVKDIPFEIVPPATAEITPVSPEEEPPIKRDAATDPKPDDEPEYNEVEEIPVDDELIRPPSTPALEEANEMVGEEQISIDKEKEDRDEEEKGFQDTASVAPLPKAAFKSWQQAGITTIHPVKRRETPGKEQTKLTIYEVKHLFKKKKKKKKKKKDQTKRIAMESLLEHDDVISETLAELLAEQGNTKKAIKMYKRLSELYPDKRKGFQKRIKQLKNDS